MIELMESDGFRRDGFAEVVVDAVTFVVVDADRHPLGVWEVNTSPMRHYARTALRQGVVATNGPLMGRRVAPVGQLNKATLTAGAGFAGLTVGAMGARFGHGVQRAANAAVAGGVASAATGVALVGSWQPAGRIVADGRRRTATFDDEGPTHAHLVRTGDGFAHVRIGDGDPPRSAVCGVGGLIRLVRASAAVDITHGDRAPAVGWALVPTATDGALVVAGGDRVSLNSLARRFADIGATDAVASDPSGCAVFTHLGAHRMRPPRLHRQAIQRYGLCCGAAG